MSLIHNVLRWARITKPSNDVGQFPVQQMEYLGKIGEGVMLFPYGYHGNVPDDFVTLMGSVQGSSDNRVAIGCLPKNRPILKPGEVTFYHPPTDAFIMWRANGDLDIITGDGGKSDINITAKSINITGDLNVTGNTAFFGTVKANGKVIDDTHGHSQDLDSDGNSQENITGVL